MSVYAFATHTLAFLAGSGLACWLVPWLIDRGAQQHGYDDGYEKADQHSLILPKIELSTRLNPYGNKTTADPVSRVDPPTASY